MEAIVDAIAGKSATSTTAINSYPAATGSVIASAALPNSNPMQLLPSTTLVFSAAAYTTTKSDAAQERKYRRVKL